MSTQKINNDASSIHKYKQIEKSLRECISKKIASGAKTIQIQEMNQIFTDIYDAATHDSNHAQALVQVSNLFKTIFKNYEACFGSKKEITLNLKNKHIKTSYLEKCLNLLDIESLTICLKDAKVTQLTLVDDGKDISGKGVEGLLTKFAKTGVISTVCASGVSVSVLDILVSEFNCIDVLKIYTGVEGAIGHIKFPQLKVKHLDLSTSKINTQTLKHIAAELSRCNTVTQLVLNNCFNDEDLNSDAWREAWSDFLSVLVDKDISMSFFLEGNLEGSVSRIAEADIASHLISTKKSAANVLAINTKAEQIIINLSKAEPKVLKVILESAKIDTLQVNNIAKAQFGLVESVLEKIKFTNVIAKVNAKELNHDSFNAVMNFITNTDIEVLDISNTKISSHDDLVKLSDNLHCAKKLVLDHCFDAKVDDGVWSVFVQKLAAHPSLEYCSLDYSSKAFLPFYQRAKVASEVAIRQQDCALDLNFKKDMDFLELMSQCRDSDLTEIFTVSGVKTLSLSGTFPVETKQPIREGVVKALKVIGNSGLITKVKIDEASADIFAIVVQYNNLQDFSLRSTKESTINKLFDVLKLLGNAITVLDLSGTHITDTQLPKFSHILHSNSTIKKLSLNGCFNGVYKNNILDCVVKPLLQHDTLEFVSVDQNAACLPGQILNYEDVSPNLKLVPNSLAAVLKFGGIQHMIFRANDSVDESLLSKVHNTGCIEEITLVNLSKVSSSKVFSSFKNGVQKLNLPSFECEDLTVANISTVSFIGSSIDGNKLQSLSDMLPRTKFTHIDIKSCLGQNITDVWMNFVVAIIASSNIRVLSLDEGHESLTAENLELVNDLIRFKNSSEMEFCNRFFIDPDCTILREDLFLHQVAVPFVRDTKVSASLSVHALKMIFDNYSSFSDVQTGSIQKNELGDIWKIINTLKGDIKDFGAAMKEQYSLVLQQMLKVSQIDTVTFLCGIPGGYDMIYPAIKKLSVISFDSSDIETILAPIGEEVVTLLDEDTQQKVHEEITYRKQSGHSRTAFCFKEKLPDMYYSILGDFIYGTSYSKFLSYTQYLEHLDLHGDVKEDVLLGFLRNLSSKSQLKSLGIGCHIIGSSDYSKVIDMLAQVLPLSSINQFSLRGMKDCSLKKLFEVLPQTRITSFDMHNSHIKADDLEIFSDVLPQTNITALSLKGCITDGHDISLEEYFAMLRDTMPQSEETTIFTDEFGEVVVEESSDQQPKVCIDQFGRAYVVDALHQPAETLEGYSEDFWKKSYLRVVTDFSRKHKIDVWEKKFLEERLELYPGAVKEKFIEVVRDSKLIALDMSGNSIFFSQEFFSEIMFERNNTMSIQHSHIDGAVRHIRDIMQEVREFAKTSWYENSSELNILIDKLALVREKLLLLNETSKDFTLSKDELVNKYLSHLNVEGKFSLTKFEWCVRTFDVYDDEHDKLLPWNVEEDVSHLGDI